MCRVTGDFISSFNSRWCCWIAVHSYWKHATVLARMWKNDIMYFFFCTFIDHLLTGPEMPHGSSNCYRAVAETHWFIPVTDTRNLSGVHKIKWISPWDNERTVRQRDMSNVKIEAWDLTCGLFTLHSQSQCCHLPYMIKKMRFASQHYRHYKIISPKNIQQILSNINNLQFFFQCI